MVGERTAGAVERASVRVGRASVPARANPRVGRAAVPARANPRVGRASVPACRGPHPCRPRGRPDAAHPGPTPPTFSRAQRPAPLSRHSLLAALALAALGLPLGCNRGENNTQPAPTGRPNVLLVTLDTTRADRFSCYGYNRPTTPHFDELAADGVLFEHAISNSATTPIAHASILTGLYQYHHGVRVIYAGSGYYLDEAIPSLPTQLKAAGWATGAFLSSFAVSDFYGFDHSFDTFNTGLKQPAQNIMQTSPGGAQWSVEENQRRSDNTADVAVEWLKSRGGKPFFCWVHFWDPHDPQMIPPTEFISRFPPLPDQVIQGRPHPKLATYDAEVAFVDHNFGRLIETLKQTGQYDNTIIAVVSDHGEGLGDHDWMNHRLLYQEQIHLPLILKMPNGPRGKRVAALVRNVDIFPTLMEALGFELKKGADGEPLIDGRSMLGLMRGETEPPRFAYADQLNRWDENASMVRRRPDDAQLHCMSDGTWKLIYRLTVPEKSLLFNLAEDPREQNNLYAPDHPEARRLQAMLDAVGERGAYVRTPFKPGGSNQAMTILQQMGYIGNGPTSQPTPTPP